MLLQNSVNRLAWCTVDICLLFVKNKISVKHNKAKCKIKRYACTLIPRCTYFPGGSATSKEPTANARDIEMRVQSLGEEDPLEEGMATHFLAWGIPWAEESGRLQSMASQRVGQTEGLRMWAHA